MSSDCCSPGEDQSSNCCGLATASHETHQDHDEHRQTVRDAYAQVARANDEGCATGIESSCCGVSDDAAINTLISTRLGYSETDLQSVPEGADMGLGCGNPRAIASLKPGETVIVSVPVGDSTVFWRLMKSRKPVT